MLQLDHLAVTAPTLEDGVAYVEQALGVTLAPGGQHGEMGTHNRLLKLGERLYLEVIAVDPAAPEPPHARWFGLDGPLRGARLTNWIVRTGNLIRTLATVPLDLGRPMALKRGAFSWQMAVPASGQTPMSGACPAVIQWEGTAHPAHTLPNSGCDLVRLTISHPRAEDLVAAFPGLRKLANVRIEPGPLELAARIQTPTGRWTLT